MTYERAWQFAVGGRRFGRAELRLTARQFMLRVR